MIRLWRKRITLGNQRGFTLVELMIVVAVIGILAAIGISLYADILVHARLAKARADTRTLAGAVTTFSAHTGGLPANLATLTTTAADPNGITAGPFMGSIPVAPPGWAAYALVPDTAMAGAYQVTSGGDGTSAAAP